MTSPAPGPVDIQHEFCSLCEGYLAELKKLAGTLPAFKVRLEWWEHIVSEHTGKDVAGVGGQEPVLSSDLPRCECCEEPWCPECETHYSDCSCPGPHGSSP